MSKFTTISVACAAILSFTVMVAAQADPVIHSRGAAAQTAGGGFVARSTLAAQGGSGALGGQRGFVADGRGNVSGATGSGFTTASGGQGLRMGKVNRTSDGALTASWDAAASGQNGSADRSRSFTRSADGSAFGERSTTITNANTGVTFDGATTYSKGSGVSRSASCMDAAGNTVACTSR
jgi:hypothetical protein